MRWSELPQQYRDLEIHENAKRGLGINFKNDNIWQKISFSETNEGFDFWHKCHIAKTIDELPPLPEKEFVLPEKWCIKADQDSDVHMWFNKKLNRYVYLETTSYFHYPELPEKTCTTYFVEKGYKGITYDQWVKYVRDAEYKENALCKNDNLEKIKEMQNVQVEYNDESIINFVKRNKAKELHNKIFKNNNDTCIDPINKVKEPIEPFYMVYVDGATGSNVKHDFESAQKEAERLSNISSKKVYILKPVLSLEREVIIRKSLL